MTIKKKPAKNTQTIYLVFDKSGDCGAVIYSSDLDFDYAISDAECDGAARGNLVGIEVTYTKSTSKASPIKTQKITIK